MLTILEKVVHQQLYDYVIHSEIISNFQSGFRKGFSTTTLLMNVSDNIITSLDNGLATALVLLYFSKGFDTLDHTLLCAKLNFYGFDPVSVNFFESYLIGRQQKVILDESFSRIAHVTSGVPQGSVLGPILFLIYISDIFDKVEYSNINAFADDTQISFPFSPKVVERA